MEFPNALFYLIAENTCAVEIVNNPLNRLRKGSSLSIATKPYLAIGFDHPPKKRPYLVRFGRLEHNDVILGNQFSRNDQCYFDLNKTSAELVLHDISKNGSTQIFPIEENKGEDEQGLMSRIPRQCAVVLSSSLSQVIKYHDYTFMMRHALFTLKARRPEYAQQKDSLNSEKEKYARQPDPDLTVESTTAHLIQLGVEYCASQALTSTQNPPSTAQFNKHHTRFGPPLKLGRDNVIRYFEIKHLGSGGEGQVHKVADLHNGNHYACKVVMVKKSVPCWGINSENEFRAKVQNEIKLVEKVHCHPNIVSYVHTQGFAIDQPIEIFMPLYEGDLNAYIKERRLEGQLGANKLAETIPVMTRQMLDALCYVHQQVPPIIHRDIKPMNILYKDDDFFLTDFGIAKIVDTSSTVIGTWHYMAPETLARAPQTTKVDIFALGMTIANCLKELPPLVRMESNLAPWKSQHASAVNIMQRYRPSMVGMLANDPDERPTALKLLLELPPTSTKDSCLGLNFNDTGTPTRAVGPGGRVPTSQLTRTNCDGGEATVICELAPSTATKRKATMTSEEVTPLMTSQNPRAYQSTDGSDVTVKMNMNQRGQESEGKEGKPSHHKQGNPSKPTGVKKSHANRLPDISQRVLRSMREGKLG